MLGSEATSRLVGRDEDLEILDYALDQAHGGSPSVTFVVGEYGIGKTRLVRELEVRARRRRIPILAGECVPLEGTELPYGPIGSGLRNLPHDLLEDALAQLSDGARAQLASAFPQLPATLEPMPQAGDPRQARFYEYLLGLLDVLSAPAALLVVAEDFHWADGATRNFVSFLVRNLRAQRIALVVTARTEDLTEDDRRWREDLSKRARAIELSGLDRASVGALLAAGLGKPPGDALLDDVLARSAGNPFFAQELLSAQVDRASHALPATLRDALITRVHRLSPDAQRIVLPAAAVARACGSTLLGRAATLREPELSRAVRETLDGNVLEQVSGGDAFQFRHDVVREVVYGDLLPGERAELHARIATTMVELGAAVGPGELAYHWRAAGRTGEAIVASIEAARDTYEAHAFSEALAHFDRALELADEAGGLPDGIDLDRADLLRMAAETARYAGDNGRAAALVERALQAVDATAEPARAARLHELWGHCQAFGYDAALNAFQAALALLPPSHDADRARVLAAEANALTGRGTRSALIEAADRATAALTLAERVEAREEEAHARIMLGLALAILGQPDDGAEHLRRATSIARELGHAEDLLRAHLYLGEALRLGGDFTGALATMDAGRACAVELGMEASFGRFMGLNGAEDLFLLGRWEETRLRLEEAALERDPTSWNRLLSSLLGGQLALARGDLAAADAQLSQADAVYEAEERPAEYAGSLNAALAELALARREHEIARRLVDTGRAAVGDVAHLLYPPVLFSIGARVEADAADAGRAAREDAARRAAELRDALAAMIPDAPATTPPPTALAHLALCEAERARAAGVADPDAWADASARWDAIGAPYEAAYARTHQAAAVMQSHGDRVVAADLLSHAYDTAEQLGAVRLRVQVELLAGRDLVHLQVRHGAGAAAPAKTTGDDFDLTPREREVLALLAAGLTNRAIAEQLVISEKTAGVHVSRIFAKLDVHDRRVAATRAYQLGLAGPP